MANPELDKFPKILTVTMQIPVGSTVEADKYGQLARTLGDIGGFMVTTALTAQQAEQTPIIDPVFAMPTDELFQDNARIMNILYRHGARYARDILALGRQNVLYMSMMGASKMNQIESRLQEVGIAPEQWKDQPTVADIVRWHDSADDVTATVLADGCYGQYTFRNYTVGTLHESEPLHYHGYNRPNDTVELQSIALTNKIRTYMLDKVADFREQFAEEKLKLGQ